MGIIFLGVMTLNNEEKILEILFGIQGELKTVNQKLDNTNIRLTNLESRMDSMESRMTNMQSRMDSMESRMTNMESRMDGMESRMDNIELRIGGLESQVAENTQILKALEHKTDIIKAEQENMKHEIVKLSGEVKFVKNDIEDIKHTNRSIFEMYGKHEASIISLTRRDIS